MLDFDNSWKAMLFPGSYNDYFSMENIPAFEPLDRSYNTSNAVWLAEASRLIYKQDVSENPRANKKTRNDFLRRVGLREVDKIRGPIITVSVIEPVDTQKQFAIVAFRGTEQTFSSWFVNFLTVPMIDWGNIPVHRGFAQLLEYRWNEVEALLNKIDKPIFLTGHSTGAAFATLTGVRYKRNVQAVYAIACPPLGSKQWKEVQSEFNIYRIINCNDVVVKLPGKLEFLYHTGTAYVLTDIPGSPSDPTQFTVRRRSLFSPPECVSDHAPINYVMKLLRGYIQHRGECV